MQSEKLNQIIANRIAYTLVMMLFMSGVIMYYQIILGIFGLIASLVAIYLNWLGEHRRRKQLMEFVEQMGADIDLASKSAVLNLPIPMTIANQQGKVLWYNTQMHEIVHGKEMLDQHLDTIITGFAFDKRFNDISEKEIKINERYYRIQYLDIPSESDKQQVIKLIVFIDVTAYRSLKNLYADERIVISLLQVDNYEDVMNETKEDKRPFVIAEIDKKINIWASRMNALIKKYDKDKYLVLFEHKFLSNLEAKKFAILDDIRDIDLGNRIMPTLSIGIAMTGNGPSKMEENAFSALELALGRGGDQAVIRRSGDFDFYGGKTKAVEKRNKVKARIIAHAFRPIIDDSRRVFIMGHKFPDMDSYGSAVGIFRACLNRGKEAYIVIEDINESIKHVHEKIEADSNYKFIKPEDAIDAFEPEDLLVIVDTHRPNFTESPELIQKATRKVLFDHHRRGKEFIEGALLTYLEPYASSTSELVTEVLQYMEKKMLLEKHEAEALLAGIVVDTKNFSVKTGVRTFESAALLRRFDADTTEVKKLFQDDLGTFVARSNIVSNAETLGHKIALSVTDEDIPNARLIAAQGADSLLNIRGVRCSFVVVKEAGIVFISSRSLGEVNVQLIMEKIGGGGHMTVAGAQFRDKTVSEVREILIEAIDSHFKEVKSS